MLLFLQITGSVPRVHTVYSTGASYYHRHILGKCVPLSVQTPGYRKAKPAEGAKGFVTVLYDFI
jgi:hypothetical protein